MRDDLLKEEYNKIILDETHIKTLKYDEKGLIPTIVQDVFTKEVLMLAYMNEESLLKTIEYKKACYFSRSRQELWVKGMTSGNIQEVVGIYCDCDRDAILLKVIQKGVACHTGEYSCFFNKILESSMVDEQNLISKLYKIIEDRKLNPKEGSYTNYLFEKGLDKILKKVGEESAEVIIAAKNEEKKEIIYEISDLVYHTLVLMVNSNVTIDEVLSELRSREN